MHAAVTAVLLVLLALLVAALLVVYFALIHTPYRLHRFYASQTSVPVAPFRPVQGHLPQLFAFEATHNTLGCWRAQYETFGAVHAINLGENVNLKLDDPYYLRGVLRTDGACYHKSVMGRLYLKAALGMSNLLMLEDEGHARHRKMINPGSAALHRQAYRMLTRC